MHNLDVDCNVCELLTDVSPLQSVADHAEFQHMETGETRLREDRHYSAAAQTNEGQVCAADHGTHVASLAAGFESGAGKGADIVSGMLTPIPLTTAFRVYLTVY